MAAASNTVIKQKNLVKTAMYILDHEGVSRQQIAADLGLSMPTVFQNVNDLLEYGLVCEDGEYGSTGGGKAKKLTIKQGVCCALGVEITSCHVHMVLMDMSRKLISIERKQFCYEDATAYYIRLGELIQEYIERHGVGQGSEYRLIGVGIVIPGILDQERGVIIKSHALGVANISLRQFWQNRTSRIPFTLPMMRTWRPMPRCGISIEIRSIFP